MTKFDDEAAGTAMAAFTLAQLAFWHQIKTGALDAGAAAQMLQQGVEANAQGGPANRKAAEKLQLVLDLVLKGQMPPLH